MTIENTYTPVQVSGDGASLTFSFDFKIYADTDIAVYKEVKLTDVFTLMTLGVDYSVVISPSSEGGTITFALASVPLTTEWVWILSTIPYTQPVDIPTGGNLREKALEDGMDRTVREIQQLKHDIESKVYSPTGMTGVQLPDPEADKVIGWNSTGDALVNLDPITGPAGPTGPSGGPAGPTGATGPTGAQGTAGLGTLTVIEAIIGNGTDIISAGVWGDIQVPFDGTITSVTVLADQVATAVVDVWKDTYTNFPPTVADTITAAAKPTITAANKSTDAVLTGWTTAITAGDVFRFNVDSNDVATRLNVVLGVTRSS